MSNVLGLDLSMTSTGVILLDDDNIVLKMLIKTKPSAEKSHINELKRLLSIVDKIENIIVENKISMAIIEGLSFGARNTSSLIQLSGLNYLVRKVLYDHEVPFLICAPTTLKRFITGHGNSAKDILMLETYKRYGVTLTSNDLCDSYGLARIAEAVIGTHRLKLTVPQQEVVELLKKQI